MKIEDTTGIALALDKIILGDDGAEPTSRCLPGLYDQEHCQEWSETGTIDGSTATIYYIFDDNEVDFESDPGDYPWDAAHILYIDIDD